MYRKLDHPARAAVALASVTIGLVATTVVATTALRPTAEADPGSQCPNTAAATLGWGTPNRADDFTDPSSLNGWDLYDGVGHDGNGRRIPAAVSVADGALTITGDAKGNSGGMAWNPGQLHGRWEACVKSPAAAAGYHSLLLLWPDAEDWPRGGEVDFMEITDPARQTVEAWLHYGPQDDRERSEIQIDATRWHSWAVEWTPQRIAAYVDGIMWWETTNVAHLPPRPMHLCVQLDNFGGDLSQGGQLALDWVHQYPV